MLREADVRRVVERILKTVLDHDKAMEMSRRVIDYAKTKDDKKDLASREQSMVYRPVDYGEELPLTKNRKLDINWTDHAEYRSELRDVDPDQANESLRNKLQDRMKPSKGKKPRLRSRGTEPIKIPGVGTMVVDYDLQRKPADARVVTVWASDFGKTDSRKAARVIRLDKSAVKRLLDDLFKAVKRKVSRLPQDEPIGKLQLVKLPFILKDVAGDDVKINVILRSVPSGSPFMVTGAAAGTISATGEPAIVVELNGKYNAGIFHSQADEKRGMLYDGVWKSLLHELTHIADTYRKKKEKTTQRVLSEEEMDLDEYYNEPAEVRAFMQEIVDEVILNFPKMRKRFERKDSLRYALKMSDAWKRVGPYLNRRNRKKVLGAVWKALESEGMIASDCKDVKRLAVAAVRESDFGKTEMRRRMGSLNFSIDELVKLSKELVEVDKLVLELKSNGDRLLNEMQNGGDVSVLSKESKANMFEQNNQIKKRREIADKMVDIFASVGVGISRNQLLSDYRDGEDKPIDFRKLSRMIGSLETIAEIARVQDRMLRGMDAKGLVEAGDFVLKSGFTGMQVYEVLGINRKKVELKDVITGEVVKESLDLRGMLIVEKRDVMELLKLQGYLEKRLKSEGLRKSSVGDMKVAGELLRISKELSGGEF